MDEAQRITLILKALDAATPTTLGPSVKTKFVEEMKRKGFLTDDNVVDELNALRSRIADQKRLEDQLNLQLDASIREQDALRQSNAEMRASASQSDRAAQKLRERLAEILRIVRTPE